MGASRYIVIVGCGRLGSLLANRLSRAGHDVVVIDREESSFEALTSDFSGFQLAGDATQRSVLEAAKLADADVLIATSHEDNANLMVAQVASRLFGVPKVLARVFDPKRQDVYTHLGIETICPTTVAADLFLTAVEGGVDAPAGDDP